MRRCHVRPVRRDADRIPPRKELAPCCVARRDQYGRLPIGFCSDGCIRIPEVWASLTR